MGSFEAAFIRCYSCDSKENKCSETEYGSKIDCSASKGCRIAKKNDLEDPQWDRGCAVEADFFCDTFDNPNGEEGVSWGRKYSISLRQTSSVCTCASELCNQDWITAGSSTTDAGEELVSRPLDDLCSSYLYFCVDHHLSTQIAERQGTAMY